MGVERNPAALALARELRRAGLSVEVGDGTFRLKKSFEAADESRPPHRPPRRRLKMRSQYPRPVKTFAHLVEQIKMERASLERMRRHGTACRCSSIQLDIADEMTHEAPQARYACPPLSDHRRTSAASHSG